MTTKNLTKTLIVTFVIFSAVIGLGIFAFSKKSDEKIAGSELPPLVKKLPVQTIAFYSWRSDLPSYQAMQLKAPLHGTDSLLSQVDKLPLDQSKQKLFQDIINALTSSGLISPQSGMPDGLIEFLGFVTKGEHPNLGLFLHAKETVDLQALTNSLRTTFQREQVIFEEAPIQDRTLIKISDGAVNLFAIIQDHQAAIATSENIVKDFFAPKDTGGIAEIRSNPRYEKYLTFSSPQQFGVGIADVTALSDLMKDKAPPEDVSTLEDLPFGVMWVKQSAGDMLQSSLVAELAPKNEQHRRLIKNVSKPVVTDLSSRLPKAVAFYLSVDGQIIHTIQEGATSDLTNDEKSMLAPYNQHLDALKGAAVGALSGDKSSLFPDFFVTAQSSNAPELLSFVKNEAKELISSQIPMADWLQKNIEGVQVNYILTPLGIGLFLGAKDDLLFITSSEVAMTKLIGQVLSPKGGTGSNLIDGTIDFRQIGETVETVQGSMSLLTGGASTLNVEQIQDLKRLGNATFSLQIDGNYLKLDWTMKPTANASPTP